MAKAYAALRSALSPTAEEALKRSQAAFIADRALSCGAKGDMPKDASRRRDIESCLAQVSGSRATFLASFAPAVAGALLVEPHSIDRDEAAHAGAHSGLASQRRDCTGCAPGAGGRIPCADARLRPHPAGGSPDRHALIAASDHLEGGRERSYAVHWLTERFASLRFTTRTEAGTSTPPAS